MKRFKQGYNARIDESLGERRGAEKNFRQSLKDRRDESKGEEKRDSGHAYAADSDMDENYKNHMSRAHHKFMANKYRKMMHKK